MADEVIKAQAAALSQLKNPGDPTIFDKILAKEIPSSAVHEDDLCYAFRDIAPQAPTHVLVIPKIRAGLTQISKSGTEHAALLGHMMVTASAIGKAECPEGVCHALL